MVIRAVKREFQRGDRHHDQQWRASIGFSPTVSYRLRRKHNRLGADGLGLQPVEETIFPFSGTDTVYSITVTNIMLVPSGSIVGFTYNVTLFDPSVPGTDYVATVVVGTNTPYLNTGNPYSCVPIANPNATGYQWLTAQATNGNLTDNANNGLTNFTISPTPIYSVITNPPTGSGKCFHLCHTNPVSQYLAA